MRTTRLLLQRCGLIGLTLAMLLGATLARAAPEGGAARAQAAELSLAARPAFAGTYRPGSWLPLVVDLANQGPDRQVELQAGPPDRPQFSMLVDLPHNAQKSVTLYVYLSARVQRMSVRAISAGAELASEDVDLQPVAPNSRVLGLLAVDGASFRMPQRLSDQSSLASVVLRASDLPEQSLGLGSFTSLLLEDLATAELSPGQLRALEEWVLRGGQLLIGGGPGAARTLAGLPERLRPAQPGDLPAIPAAELLGPDLAAAPALPLTSYQPAGDGPLYPVPGTALGAAAPPILERAVGQGVVTLLPLPLSHPALQIWPGLPNLLSDLLRPTSTLPAGFIPDTLTRDSFEEGNLASTLTGLPALEFPPPTLLIGLLAAYIVIVGPGSYLVLRRLDRQALGWVVVPLITILFAGLTYGIGYARRGGDVLINQATLVELFDQEGTARVRSFAGVFSPAQRSYNVLTSGVADDQPLLLRPISLQGPWDPNAGASGGIYDQTPGQTGARDFVISQWSMRALASDQIAEPLDIQSTVRLGEGGLYGEVQNNSDQTLYDVVLVHGTRLARLGELAPGQRAEAALEGEPIQPGFGSLPPLSYRIYGALMEQANREARPLDPSIQARMRLLDAIYNYGPTMQSSEPLLLAWSDGPGLSLNTNMDRTDQQNLTLVKARPALVVEGAALSLGSEWFSQRFLNLTNTGQFCFGSIGAGLAVSPAPDVIELSLPPELSGLQVSELNLITAADGAWLNVFRVDLFNWETGQWVAQPAQGDARGVAEPASFVSSHGKVRVQLWADLPEGALPAGCVYANAELKGLMP